jgi:hypothetical protein
VHEALTGEMSSYHFGMIDDCTYQALYCSESKIRNAWAYYVNFRKEMNRAINRAAARHGFPPRAVRDEYMREWMANSAR